nr:hypothetical protein [Tanacetum cinerariifolium]
CSRVFSGDIYGDHAVSCAGIIGIKHHHNVVRDTLVDICFRSGISSGKEVDIGLDRRRDNKLRLPICFFTFGMEFLPGFFWRPTLVRIKCCCWLQRGLWVLLVFVSRLVVVYPCWLYRICGFGFGSEKLCFSDRGVVGKVLGQFQVPYLGDHFGSYLVCDVIDPPLLQQQRQQQQQHPTKKELKAKHPCKSAPSLLDTPIDHHHLITSETVVLDMIKSFPRSTSCGRDGLCAKHLVDCLRKCPMILGEYIASALLTPLVKPGGGIRPIDFGVGVPRGGEAILYAVNRLVEDRGDDLSLSMLLVDFQNAFNLIDRTVMLDEAWYLDDGTIVGDTLAVGKVLELIKEDGLRCGLHLNIDKTELFWPKEDHRSRLEGVSSPNISRPLHGVKLLGGPVSVDHEFSSALVIKRVLASFITSQTRNLGLSLICCIRPVEFNGLGN